MTDRFDDETERRIVRYLAGQCSDEEAAELRARMAADSGLGEYVADLERTWELADELPTRWSSGPPWDAVRERIERRERSAQAVRDLRLVPPRFALPASSPLLRIAAAVALVAGASAAWWATSGRDHVAPVQVAFREYTAARGERLETRLADGTRVLLRPESKLLVPSDFGRPARNVRLEGEAYFEVTHDAARPFTVQAKNAVALDLGTRFSVQAYADDARVQVIVAEGKVSLGPAVPAADSAPVLVAGELGRLDRSGGTEILRGVDLDRYLRWTEGELVFRGTPLREAVVEIARWHDIEIELASAALGDKRLTASFRDESAAEVLRMVAAVLDLEVVQRDRVFTLGPR